MRSRISSTHEIPIPWSELQHLDFPVPLKQASTRHSHLPRAAEWRLPTCTVHGDIRACRLADGSKTFVED